MSRLRSVVLLAVLVALLGSLLPGAVAGPAAAATTATLVEDFDEGASSWAPVLGTGSLGTDRSAPAQGTAALSLTYDVTAGSFEVGRRRTPEDLPATAFSGLKLSYRGDGTYNTLYLRLRDATGEIFYYRVGTLDKTAWTTATVDLTAAPAARSGGNADGILDAPMALFGLAVVRNGTQPPTGSVHIDDLRTVDDGSSVPSAQPRIFSSGSTTVLSFRVGAPGSWRLVLRDSSGAHRTLTGSVAAAGVQRVAWNGLSDAGTALSGSVSGALSMTPTGAPRATTVGTPYLAGISARPASATSPAVLGANTAMSTYEGLATADAEAKRLEDAFAGYAREEFEWNRVEPRDGYYDWPKFDQMVAVAQARNIKIVGKLVYSADWASSAPAGTPTATARYYPPADLNAWSDYVQQTVSRYAGRVTAWEVWNEPNLDRYWAPTPDPARYAEMLRATYPVIKAADPAATVLLGGPAGGFSESFMSALKANGAGDSFDALALHLYVNGAPEPSIIESWFSTAQTWVARNTPGRPIWITEFGWTTCDSCTNRATEQQQADYLSRLALDAVSNGVAGLLWYNLRENGTSGSSIDNYGLVERGGRLKPAYGAFQRFGQATAASVGIGAASPSPDGSTSVVEDFASTTGISRSSLGSGGSTSLSTTTSRVAGAGALAVDYDYTAAEAKGSLITLNEPVAGTPTALSLWVYGDSSNHTVFLKFRDAAGESFEAKIGSVGTPRWNRLVYYFDGGDPSSTHSGGDGDGVVDYPVTVTQVHVYKSTSGVTRGRFVLDDLSAHYGGATRGVVLLSPGGETQAVYALAPTPVSLSQPSGTVRILTLSGSSALAVTGSKAAVQLSPTPVFVSSMLVAKSTAGRAPVALSLVTGDRSTLTIDVLSSTGPMVKTLAKEQQYRSGPRTISWDGVRSDGVKAKAGSYSFRITSKSAAGTVSATVPFTLT